MKKYEFTKIKHLLRKMIFRMEKNLRQKKMKNYQNK